MQDRDCKKEGGTDRRQVRTGRMEGGIGPRAVDDGRWTVDDVRMTR
jgi:hypothetical protein